MLDRQIPTTTEVTVRESDELVDTNIDVEKGDTLIFDAQGTIWAGVIFTARNGPQGWNNYANDLKFPDPDAHAYCLLGKIGGGTYFEIGAGGRIDHHEDGGRLYLTINDDVHGNGDGAFTCHIQHYTAALVSNFRAQLRKTSTSSDTHEKPDAQR